MSLEVQVLASPNRLENRRDKLIIFIGSETIRRDPTISYPLIKEYDLNNIGLHIMIYAIFLN